MAHAKRIAPVLNELIRQATQGSVMHNDDMSTRILRLARNPDDGRTGTFTSGIVSILREWKIARYFAGWKHAGEKTLRHSLLPKGIERETDTDVRPFRESRVPHNWRLPKQRDL